ncbi:MAG TPA: hypothetical protein VK174_04620 [Chitinophagales bacterium]|nr:hypothetical protein [Chitinophagales bacterium]HLP50629.1 hypothetical protein [Chitinophagales bacterium]
MSKKLLSVALGVGLMLGCSVQLNAQNKDIDKGKETLTKAMEQKDAAKRNEMVQKATESFQKGGMKREMYALIGDAFLEKKDYTNAQSNYSRCDKPEKKEGMKKLAEAYVEEAFSGEEKNEPKHLRKAMDFYTKAEAAKEGARVIGDRYYERGPAAYNKALEYYIIGGAEVKVEQIAKEYEGKGGDEEVKAAETYLKLKTTEGAKKAGDIYYRRNEYQKAIDAYLSGGVEEGITKYADYLYSENRSEDADNLLMRLGDVYTEKKNEDATEKLAASVMNKGSYVLASKLYDKAGNVSMGDKARAYDALTNFRLEEAKGLFNQINDAATVKLITDNQKVLTPLQDLAETLEALMKNAPNVSMIVDSLTGKSTPSSADQKTQEDYYKSIRDQVITNVNSLSVNYAKLTDPTLKKYVRQRFLRYGAVRNILDKETFTIKKQKQDIKVRDVIL